MSEATRIGVIPAGTTGIRLARIIGEDLRLCEEVHFTRGAPAVDTVLRRARLSGRVEVDPAGPLPDYFADLLDQDGSMTGNVALDRGSFNKLKTHWMRCKYQEPSA